MRQKDSSGVKEALDRLSEEGWAKKWSSQPYMSRRTVYIRFSILISTLIFNEVGVEELMRLCFFLYQTSLRELTNLGIKNAENLAIPSVRNDVSSSFFSCKVLMEVLLIEFV